MAAQKAKKDTTKKAKKAPAKKSKGKGVSKTTGKPKNGIQGEGGGRPFAIDMKDPENIKRVDIFGSLCATQQEMADWFGCSIKTIEAYMADEEHPFTKVYRHARSKFKSSLRSKQRELALEGNPALLIWLGKQVLDQKDKTENDMNIKTPVIKNDIPRSYKGKYKN